MLDILLVVHVVIAILLITVILLQKNSADALAGLSGGGNNMGIVSARGAANFMTRMTVILAIAFMTNSLILANLSNKSTSKKDEKGLTETLQKETGQSRKVPMAE